MGILGFFIMIIIFCIVAGQSGYDKGLTYYGRDKAKENGDVFYCDGKGTLRSTANHKKVIFNRFNGCRFVYEWDSKKVIKDFNEEELIKRNKELMAKGMKIRYGLVYYSTYSSEERLPFDPMMCGNIWIGIENETNKPVTFYEIKHGPKAGWYKYYFHNDQVGVGKYTDTYEGKKFEEHYLCNVDKKSGVLIPPEVSQYYDIYSDYSVKTINQSYYLSIISPIKTQLACVHYIKTYGGKQ